MEWFIAVVIVAALGVAAVAAAGGLGGMAKEPVRDVYRQDLPEHRQLAAADVQALRFGTALRGYAMGQVDDVLDRLAREIAERDALIADLRTVAGVQHDMEDRRAVEDGDGAAADETAPADTEAAPPEPSAVPSASVEVPSDFR
jgi:DivIVA domain-containing protein